MCDSSNVYTLSGVNCGGQNLDGYDRIQMECWKCPRDRKKWCDEDCRWDEDTRTCYKKRKINYSTSIIGN